MFRNYLLTVLRSWASNKLFTFINIGGLTVGLICAAFIMLFMRDELSYDRWIPDSENLYRVSMTVSLPGRPPQITSSIPFPLPPAMADQIPEVTAAARLVTQGGANVSVGDRQFNELLNIVDPQFLQVVKLPLIEGDPDSVLSHPESVVISQSIAKKYFGRETGNVGKNLTVSRLICPRGTVECRNETYTLIITGILRDLPHNTQMAANIVIPNTSQVNTMPPIMKENWLGLTGYGYVKLSPGTDSEKVLAKLKDLIDRSASLKAFGIEAKRSSDVIIPQLTRFWDAHLTIDQYGSLTPPGSRITVYGFGVIGAFILLLACFNFTNLTLAGATLRAREISLRKVMGARRNQIVVQFLGEAVLMALIAFVLSLALIQPLLPSFNRLLNKPIAIDYLGNWPMLVMIAAVSTAAGLISGFYPAIVLSKFKPAIALRSNTAQVANSGRFRTVLVILQFAVSIGLGISAVVVFAQISHMRHADLGFRKDGVVVVGIQKLSASSRESFVNALRNYPGVVQATLESDDAIPMWGNTTMLGARLSGTQAQQAFRRGTIGPEFASTYEIPLLAGRLLSDAHGEDQVLPGHSGAYNLIINVSAARRFGLGPEEALGKTLTLTGDDNIVGGIGTIVGVINDIKMDGPLHGTGGALYLYEPNNFTFVSVRARSEDFSDALAFIDKTWSAFAPDVSIQRFLLEDQFNKLFDSAERQGTGLNLFVGIAIFIACMGLFGLAAFAAERRTKEIGLRKTFGAKTHHVVLLLLWQFSIPVLIANGVAWPVAYYYLHGWLNGYADRVSLNPLYFIGAGFAALAIALATVYVHAYRMARANPINALRHE